MKSVITDRKKCITSVDEKVYIDVGWYVSTLPIAIDHVCKTVIVVVAIVAAAITTDVVFVWAFWCAQNRKIKTTTPVQCVLLYTRELLIFDLFVYVDVWNTNKFIHLPWGIAIYIFGIYSYVIGYIHASHLLIFAYYAILHYILYGWTCTS